jgi:hypothetical protein
MDEDAVGKGVDVWINSDHPNAIRRFSKRRGRIHNANDPASWIQFQRGPAHQQSASINASTLHVRHTHSIWEYDCPGNFILTATRRGVVNHALAKQTSHAFRYDSLEECNACHMPKPVLELRGWSICPANTSDLELALEQ